MSVDRKLHRKWEEAGWLVKPTKSGHFMLSHPDGAFMISWAGTPSDHRAVLNTEARMRRSLREGVEQKK